MTKDQKRKKAVALKYDQDKGAAPIITASGKGLIADAIIDKAAEHQIPTLEDESLVEILSQLDINQTIPDELYQAVAEVFAFIYHTDKNVEYSEKNK
ncbi:EscU/YscU/HrcU family type III secretion system export apparatus switch protein [Ornithinibacillus sp. 4-3]|uniref:EscU/YscU/HrcU family type III secretion system export apparatus switch protein n=1 Tax=Ornithinibacillus sp. 4-3 TaxID=3231488 RepID=A0AB39HUC4_9BACI